MELSVGQRESAVWLDVRGPVRLGDAAALLEAANNALATSGDVVVTLGSAEHLHAAAIQVLLATEQSVKRRGRAFRIEGVSEAAANALSWVGVQHWR